MRRIVLWTLFIIAVSSCSVMDQAAEIKKFAQCEFRLHSVDELMLAGVDIQEVDSYQDLGFLDLARITTALAGGELELSFNLNVQARNPNDGIAAMNRMEWVLFIDDIEMTDGLLEKRIEIPPLGGITVFPVHVTVDLLEVLSGESGEALYNFAFNLSGNGGRPTRLLLKAKPSVMIGSRPVEYPGYINIRQEFSSQ